jgi:hypothetical protein
MTPHLHAIGALFLCLAFLHVGFPRYFNWRRDLASASLINRQMMQVHTAFIALTVFLIGALCLTSADDLVGTRLGKRVAMLLGIFWTLRLLVQLFWYSPALWRGKRFETCVHVLFTILWLYASVVFWLVAMG